MQNRIFFPQEALDQWIVDSAIDLRGTELSIVAEGRRYLLAEALHVQREVTGAADQHELVGKVKSRPYLEELGAELFENSMLLGDNAYDVTPGWLGAPVGTLEEHLASSDRAKAHPDPDDVPPRTDEELLSAFLLKSR
jgi:hypothetical protein